MYFYKVVTYVKNLLIVTNRCLCHHQIRFSYVNLHNTERLVS